MEETIRLATQVVILLTAVVGLYKVVIANPGGKAESKKQSTAFSKDGPFDFMFSMIGIYGGVLVPMLFMFGLIWLINAMSTSSSPKAQVGRLQAESTTVEASRLPPNEKNLFHQYEVALSISSSTDRDVAFTQIVRSSLREKAYAVSVAAAMGITASHKRDEALSYIAESAAKSGEGATAAKAVAAISSKPARDEVAKKVLVGLEGGPKAESFPQAQGAK